MFSRVCFCFYFVEYKALCSPHISTKPSMSQSGSSSSLRHLHHVYAWVLLLILNQRHPLSANANANAHACPCTKLCNSIKTPSVTSASHFLMSWLSDRILNIPGKIGTDPCLFDSRASNCGYFLGSMRIMMARKSLSLLLAARQS